MWVVESLKHWINIYFNCYLPCITGNAGVGCRYVGRKWSGCSTGSKQNLTSNPLANLSPRSQPEMTAHDVLLRQDVKAARWLCVMLTCLVVCWLPHAVVCLVQSW